MTASAPSDEPIFILGPGRSGTTLLRSLLATHSRIAILPETHFLARAAHSGSPQGGPADFARFWKSFSGSERFRDLGLDAATVQKHIGPIESPTFKDVFCALLRAYGEKVGKARVGEKTPGHVRHLETLLNWFPNARVLVMRRDPRAVVASQLKTGYVDALSHRASLRHGLLTGSRLRLTTRFAVNWRQVHGEILPRFEDDPRFLTVVYEDLVRDPEKQIRQICDFVGEAFEPAMLTDRSAETVPLPVGTFSMRSIDGTSQSLEQWRQEHYKKTFRPISSDSLEKWRQELSSRELAIVEGQCGTVMLKLGYETVLPSGHRTLGRTLSSSLHHSARGEENLRSLAKSTGGTIRGQRHRIPATLRRLGNAATRRGVPPAWLGYRCVEHETLQQCWERDTARQVITSYETIQPKVSANHPLPRNISHHEELPRDRGWWGYSFFDVPTRVSDETLTATLADATIVSYRDAAQNDDYYPAILTRDGRALDMPQIRFRPRHREKLRQSKSPRRIERATWIAERVYHNHSHWLTAHLPKLLLLRERNELKNVILPAERTPAIETSLRLLGIDVESFLSFDESRPLQVDELTVLSTDRFRPDLLRRVPQEFGVPELATAHRRIFISRAKASRRRLLNEDQVWSALKPAGFERVQMEDLDFEEQVHLMNETRILCAPHGAGLTNMMFCPSGIDIIELADLGFPNPNFYALSSAMGHGYWLVSAESVGDAHPLDRDMEADVAKLERVLTEMPSLSPSTTGGSETPA